MSFQLRLPDTVIFGRDTFPRLGRLAAGFGSRALLCTGRTALRKSGRLHQAVQLLEQAHLRTTLLEGIENDPSLHTCNRAVAAARGNNCDLVIAIGGGSVIDAAKTAAAAVTPQTGTLQEYFDGPRQLENRPLPFIALPTTAGTGSECTVNAVLTDTVRNLKKSLRHQSMMPAIALVDPDLTLPCPPEITACAGMDALTQAIESYVTTGANPFTDTLALRAIRLLAAHLPAAVAHGDNPRHREPVALGSLLAGIAFANSGLGAVHGLAHPLGVHCHIPHGLVCAVLLPHVCAFNLSVRETKFADLAPLLGADSPDHVPAAIAKLNRSLGIPDTLTHFDLTPDLFPLILAGCRSGSMKQNPRPASDEDLTRILRKLI